MSATQTKKDTKLELPERPGASATLFALIGHTLRLRFRGMLIWGLSVGLYSAAIVATFTTFSGNAAQMDQLLEAYPQELMDAFGITELSTIEGFLDSQIFNLAPLALAFFTILVAAGSIAGAEENGTIDVLLGNPLPRWQLVIGNFVTMGVALLGILTIAGIMAWATAVLVDVDLEISAAAEGFLNLWPISMLFGGLAMLCSAIFHRRALAIAIPGLVLVASYLLNALGNVSEDLEDYQPLSVFYHYGSAIRDGIDWAAFGGITAIAAGFVMLAVLAFRRREIFT